MDSAGITSAHPSIGAFVRRHGKIWYLSKGCAFAMTNGRCNCTRRRRRIETTIPDACIYGVRRLFRSRYRALIWSRQKQTRKALYVVHEALSQWVPPRGASLAAVPELGPAAGVHGEPGHAGLQLRSQLAPDDADN